jgi:predicted dehydrogenase
MKTYRAALVGAGRMGAFIDNEGHTRLPYSHSAGYEACDRTDLIAGADMRADVLEKFGERYGVPLERQYTDFREMIVKEQPDILSVATQPHQRIEVALFAIEHGVKALFLEKPLSASLEEAQQLREAVEQHGTIVNMGSLRRWRPNFITMREIIASGDLGNLETLICLNKATLFNMGSHWIDTLNVLNGDSPARWATGFIHNAAETMEGNTVLIDPVGSGEIMYENGVTAHLINRSGQHEIHAYCERGAVVALGDNHLEIRRSGQPAEVVEVEEVSPTVRCIEDIAQALDTGGKTRGGMTAAYANAELIFAMLESHLRDGARVAIPVVDSTVVFRPTNLGPRQPKFVHV